MTDNSWILYGLIAAVGLLWWRMDKLGRQLEAVHNSLLIELAPTREQREEFLNERRWLKEQEKKEQKQFWITWGVIGIVVILGWVLSVYR